MKILFLLCNALLFSFSLKSQQQVIQVTSSPAMSDFTFSGSSYVTDSYNPRKITFQDGFSMNSGQYYKQFFDQSWYSVNSNYDSIVVKVKYKTSPGYAKKVSIEAVSWMNSMYYNYWSIITGVDSGYIHITYAPHPVMVPFDVKFIAGKQDTSLNNFYIIFYDSDIKAYITGQPSVGIQQDLTQNDKWWVYENVLHQNEDNVSNKLIVHDFQGKCVLDKEISAKQTKIELQKGLYLFQVGKNRRKVLIE